MESNIVLKSKDRELFGIVIDQETKTGFLSVSQLQQAYEVARWQHGWGDKRIADIMQTNDFKERVFYLIEKQGLINTDLAAFIETVEKEGVAKVLKKLGVYKTTGARETKSTYANPYIWILLAMELNPMIYANVVFWLTDSLIFDRIEAGDEYRPMNNAIKSIIEYPEYPKYAIAINEKVFGKHLTGMRNLASSQELKRITKIEQFICQGIGCGMITTENQILHAIKHTNF